MFQVEMERNRKPVCNLNVASSDMDIELTESSLFLNKCDVLSSCVVCLSCPAAPRPVMSCLLAPCHVMSSPLLFPHLSSLHVESCKVMSCCVLGCDVRSHQVSPRHFVILCRFFSSLLVSCTCHPFSHLNMPCVILCNVSFILYCII